MATVKAPLKPNRAVGKPQSPGNETTFKRLALHIWKVRHDEDGEVFERPYVLITTPFHFIRKWIYSEPYNSQDGTGWQRKASIAHIKLLRKAMEEDDYTPTIWVASADDWHIARKLEHPIEEGFNPEIDLTVSEDHKLRLTDANHRFEATKLLRSDMIRDERQDVVDLIDQTPITIQVFLSPQHLMTDFLRLQRGKAVGRSQLASMKLATKTYSPEMQKYIELATETARILNEDERSHLYREIEFDTSQTKEKDEKRIQYSSLIAEHASSMAWTLYGGAKIAECFNKDARWLANMYIETYQALAETIDLESNTPQFMSPNERLCPYKQGGSKGGSFMIIGLANCLAWRMGYLDKDEIDPEYDSGLVAEVAAKKLVGPSKLSITDKREDMGVFARAYFANFKNPDNNRAIPKVDGIPEELVVLMSPSTWNVAKVERIKWTAARKAEAKEAAKAAEKAARLPSKPVKPVLRTEDEPVQVMEGEDE